MKFLYVPWRSKYVQQNGPDKNPKATKDVCVFCLKFSENNDTSNFILARFKYNLVILNLYPYNTGHLMILPNTHVQRLDELSTQARSELIELINHSINILEEQLNCEGINFGINLGKIAGAGIPSHLHTHIVPRWQGDTNFLPIIADVKIISFDLNKIYNDLKPKFEELTKLLDK
ncbi:MAG: HIT domain-containing protein [Candidatus Babeliales bacterium]|nr:HIT domain-containing protein [Candidatus Babeliales bacterium]